MDESKRLIALLNKAESASSTARKYAKECEQYYYDDVEDTYTQFKAEDVDKIIQYSVPVSTKFAFAIIENMLAFLSSNKPYPKIIAGEQSMHDTAGVYEQLFKATWYESRANDKLNSCQRDALNTGSGYMMVRKADYFRESTTNVVIDYVPHKHILIDPETRQWDLEDAEYIIYWNLDRRSKLEKKYNIVIEKDSITDSFMAIDSDLANDYHGMYDIDIDKSDYHLEWIVYEKEMRNVYICDNKYTEMFGVVTQKKPEEITIPNPEIALLKTKQLLLEQQLSRYNQTQSEEPDPNIDNAIQEVMQGLQAIQLQMQRLPDEITAYKVTTADGRVIIATDITVTKTIRIKETLMIDQKKYYSVYRDSNKYPIRHLPFVWKGNPNRKYGMIHFIKDISDMQNKYLQEIMYDTSVNAHRKGILWEGTVIDPDQFEAMWSAPNAIVTLRPDPILKEKSAPVWIDPSPISSTLQYMLNYFRELVEYITGIYGVIQGNPNEAPATFGATQSLQSFGIQRLKQYTRMLEHFLSDLAEVTINYITAYCDRNKIIRYFDENDDMQEVQLIESGIDQQFRVRVDVGSNLPTTRQQNAQTLAFLAQTFSDDSLKALVLEYFLKIQDMKEADEIREKIDIIQQMQEQIQQMQQTIEELTSQNKTLQNNMAQKDISHNVEMIKQQAQSEIEQEKGEILQEEPIIDIEL